MELNEVKIGDKVTFKNKGKKVVGKVIHRHDERKSPHLYGHVNVQKIGGSPSYPITIHISKLQPMLEETHMADFREDIKSMLQDIIDGNNVHANATFEVLLQQKIAELVDLAKVEVAGVMFSTQTEDVDLEEGNAENKAKKNVYVKSLGKKIAQKKFEREYKYAGGPTPYLSKLAGRITSSNSKPESHAYMVRLGRRKLTREDVEQIDEGNGIPSQDQFNDMFDRLSSANKPKKKFRLTNANREAQRDLTNRWNNALHLPDQKMKESMQEAKDSYEIYHDHYNTAVNHAAEHVHKKTGLHVHERDLMNIPRKPAQGKTNSLRFQLHKDGQPTDKYAHVQVYHHDGKTKKPFELNMYHDTGKHKILEEVEQMDEVITKKTATGDVIRDFVHSKNSRFKGKSKKERIRMALGAKYSMMKEALVGGQKKLDMNHNNKLDAHDFKIIRKKKK